MYIGLILKEQILFGTFGDFQNLNNNCLMQKILKSLWILHPITLRLHYMMMRPYAENGRLYDNGLLLGGYDNDYNHYFHHNGGTDFEEYEDGVYRNLFDLADLNHQNIAIDLYFKEAIKPWLDSRDRWYK
ncbi:hypothetical protein [Bacillus thuringiensis]|uniref:hypothetical protein n=1 Tax=Bacillus thuringiensis TaxID=1428 RepID=UPI0032C47ED6